MEIKINKDKLVKFLQLVLLKGDMKVESCILKVNLATGGHSNLSVIAKSSHSSGLSGTLLLDEAPEGSYELGIGDLSLFLNLIDSFTTPEIVIAQSGGKIKLSGWQEDRNTEKVVNYKPLDTTFITNTIEVDKFKKHYSSVAGNEFLLTEDNAKKITSSWNTISGDEIELIGSGKAISFSIKTDESEHNLKDFIYLEEELKEPFKAKCTKRLIDIINCVGGGIHISGKDQGNIAISYDVPDISMKYVVATIV